MTQASGSNFQPCWLLLQAASFGCDCCDHFSWFPDHSVDVQDVLIYSVWSIDVVNASSIHDFHELVGRGQSFLLILQRLFWLGCLVLSPCQPGVPQLSPPLETKFQVRRGRKKPIGLRSVQSKNDDRWGPGCAVGTRVSANTDGQ